MSRRRRAIVWGLAGLFGLLLATVPLVPNFVDWTVRRDRVAEFLSGRLDREVRIDGDIAFRLLPTPAFRLGEVTIHDLDGATEPEMFQARLIDADLALMPLLTGEYQVDRVVLIDPTITLERRAEGETNWRPLLARLTDGDGPGLAGRVSLERVVMENGRIRWIDAVTGDRLWARQVSVQLSADTLTGPVNLTARGQIEGAPVALTLAAGRLTSHGSWPINLTARHPPTETEIRLGGLLSAERGFQGDVDLNLPHLASLADPLGFAADGEGLGALPLALTGRLTGFPREFEVNNVHLSLGDNHRATGALTARFGPAPMVEATLFSGPLDLDRLLPDLAADPAEIRQWVADWLAAEVETVDGPGAEFRLRAEIDAVTLAGSAVRELRFDAGVLPSGVVLHGLSARLPGDNDIAAAAQVSTADGRRLAEGAFEVSGNDLRSLMTWLAGDLPQAPPARLRAFRSVGRLSGTAEELRLADFTLEVDSTLVSGDLTVRHQGSAGIDLEVQVDQLNIDAYWPDNEVVTQGWPAALEAALARAAEERWAAVLPEDVALSLSLGLGSLTWGDRLFRNLRFDGEVIDGQINIDALAFNGLGIDMLATGRLDPIGDLDLGAGVKVRDARTLFELIGWQDLPVTIGRWDDLAFNLDLSGDLSGGVEALSLSANASLDGGRLDWHSDLFLDRDPTEAAFAARLTHPDAVRLLHLIWPEYRPAARQGPAEIDLYLDGVVAGESLDAGRIHGRIGGTELAGSLSLDWRQPIPVLTARIGAGAVDPFAAVPRYGSDAMQQLGEVAWSGQGLDFSLLAGWQAEIVANARALTLGPVVLEDVAFRAGLADDVLTLETLSAAWLGGTLGMKGTMHVPTEPFAPVEMAGDFNLVDADLSAALGAFGGLPRLEGRFSLGFDGRTAGRTQHEMMLSLTGEGLLASPGGRIVGLDLAAIETALAGHGEPVDFAELRAAALLAGESAYGSLNAEFSVVDGVALLRSARMMTGQALAQATGRIGLGTWSMDTGVALNLHLDPEFPAFEYRLTGPPDQPEIRLDTRELQEFLTRRAAEALADRYLSGAEGAEPAPAE